MKMSGFASRLQQEIDAKGIDRMVLSAKTGIPYHRLTSWFRRETAKPTGDDLLVVAGYLNLDQDYLFNGGERRPFNPDTTILDLFRTLDAASQRELEDFARFLAQRQRQRATEQVQEPGRERSRDPNDVTTPKSPS